MPVAGVTVTTTCADLPVPSVERTVIVAVPSDTAVTSPLLTLAMFLSEETHFKVLFVASAGDIVAVN